MSLKSEPSSEPLHTCAKKVFLDRKVRPRRAMCPDLFDPEAPRNAGLVCEVLWKILRREPPPTTPFFTLTTVVDTPLKPLIFALGTGRDHVKGCVFKGLGLERLRFRACD